MIDWNERDGVTGMIWGNLDEREDHIVPCPSICEDSTFELGDYLNKQDKQDSKQKYIVAKSPEPNISGAKNELHFCSLDSNSHLHTKEEFPDSRYHMDSWSDFCIENAFGSGDISGEDHGTTFSTMVNDFTDVPNTVNADDSTFTELCQSGDILDDSGTSSFKETCGFPFHDRVECNSKPSGFSGEHEQKEADSFLDCDWGSITDFDELDGILGDGGSIFSQEMTRDVDELLSPTNSTNAASFPIHDISMSTSVEDGKDSCSLQESKKFQYKRRKSKDDKIAGETDIGEQAGCLPKSTCGTYQSSNKDIVNMVGENMVLKSRRKMKEKRTAKLRKETNACSNSSNRIQKFGMYGPFPTASQACPSSVFPREVYPGVPEYMGYYLSSHHAFTGYGYPALPFPTIPVSPHVHTVKGQPQPAPASCNIYSQQPRHPDSVQNLDVTLKTPTMTPQEKIEKLRRRQQMQAMLAIKQQGKQFDQKVGNTDIALSQKLAQTTQSLDSVLRSIEKNDGCAKGACISEPNMPLDQEGSHISVTSDNYALQEAMLCEFQETVKKLDNNLRLCMKESINRLAKGVMERRNANDKGSLNSNTRKEDMILTKERSPVPLDVETDTNAIDRILVNLLFHPTTSFTKSDSEGKSLSCVIGNTGSKQSSTGDFKTEDKVKMSRR